MVVTSQYYIAYDMHDQPYVEHHGVLGQRWGVRRWQNSDGSLTTAGRIHYGIGSERGKRSEKVSLRAIKAQEKAERKAKKQEVADMKRKLKEAEREAALEAQKKIAEDKAKKYEEDPTEPLRQYIRNNPVQIDKYIDVFSKEEMEELIETINYDDRVKRVRDREINRYTNYAKNAADILNTIDRSSDTAVKIYDRTVDVYNTIADVKNDRARKKAEKDSNGEPVEIKEIRKLPKIRKNNNPNNNPKNN